MHSNLEKNQKTILRNLARIHKLGDNEVLLSDGQLEIFGAIVLQQFNRVIIIAPTQYGKSLTVALGVLTDIMATGDRWIILAPSQAKADIIMGHIIEHIFDNPDYIAQLEIDESLDYSKSLEKLRRERSKSNLTFKNGGGVMTITLNARNKKASVESAMGFGAKKVVLDESSLINDTLYATVKRMVGGYKYEDTFILEIGNPFYRNHFYKTFYHNRAYHKIFIDYHQALREGRFSLEFIEEMRLEALFDIFYECKFPKEDEVDADGYRRLFTEELLKNAFIDELPRINSNAILGVDIGGGSDRSAFTVRADNIMAMLEALKTSNIMSNVGQTGLIWDEYPQTHPTRTNIDDTGIGRGVSDRLLELGYRVNPIIVSSKASNHKRFVNVRAENYWEFNKWLKSGGKILRNSDWNDLLEIRYKVQTDKRIIIEEKEEIKKRLGRSPDVVDSGMLTFSKAGSRTGKISVEDGRESKLPTRN